MTKQEVITIFTELRDYYEEHYSALIAHPVKVPWYRRIFFTSESNNINDAKSLYKHLINVNLSWGICSCARNVFSVHANFLTTSPYIKCNSLGSEFWYNTPTTVYSDELCTVSQQESHSTTYDAMIFAINVRRLKLNEILDELKSDNSITDNTYKFLNVKEEKYAAD